MRDAPPSDADDSEASAAARRREEALGRYDILDTAPEPAFDEVVRLLAKAFDAPIAVVNLVAEGRQFFKAEVGLGVRETPLETSFCVHALLEQDRMVVPDASVDPRFACNPLVTGEPGLRFYAGRLLKTSEGVAIGTLCVLDTETRTEGPTELQLMTLEVLANQVMSQLELRRALRERGDEEARFRAIADSMPQMVWSTRPDGFHDYYNARWYEFTGVPEGSTDGEAWNGMFHPDDQPRAWEVWRRSLETGAPYEIEYRLRHRSGVYRWTLGRANPIRDASGAITRWFGTCTDIDELKRGEEARDLLSQELSHRIKNIFAVVSALISLSARHHPEGRAFAESLKTRIAALASAHEFVRPHTARSRPTVGALTLHGFLNDLFGPYADESGAARVLLSGDDAGFDDQAATSVALLFHELATNAAKYGALSVDGGRVRLTTEKRGERFVLTWAEEGGPPVARPPERSGFGSSLAEASVKGQRGGRLTRDWRPEGLTVVADLPATALSRRRAAARAAESDQRETSLNVER